jgi:aspartate/methionine/tyrosine aminotransferase
MRKMVPDTFSSMFSRRVPLDRTPNRLHRAIERLRAAGTPLIDLALSNPTAAGFEYPENLLTALASSAALRYEPAPLGLPRAREAVAASLDIPPDRVVLTTSTSEAYSILFKLLCDPDDDVLVPQPSYPLLEYLAPLDAVRPVPYALEYHGGWSIDIDSVQSAVTDRTRALVVVNPNNPTGSYLKRRELDALSHFCASRDIVLVGDEVFFDFPQGDARALGAVRVIDQDAAVAVSLGGLSKAAGLPQLKLGWMVLNGPAGRTADVLGRLEIICDTYLSVSTPVQVAAPAIIEAGRRIRYDILERVRANASALTRAVSCHPSIELLPIEGGWYAVLRVPATRSEDDLVLELLDADNVLAHPGYFFDFPREAFVVMSLLPAPDVFDTGIHRLLARASADARA